jgi:hypothetical protein
MDAGHTIPVDLKRRVEEPPNQVGVMVRELRSLDLGRRIDELSPNIERQGAATKCWIITALAIDTAGLLYTFAAPGPVGS